MLDLRNKTVHGTGHRPPDLGGYDRAAEENEWIIDATRSLFRHLMAIGYNRYISGMAQGFDQWSLEVAIELGFHTIAAIPCIRQERKWPEQSQLHYHNLLAACSEVHLISSEEYKPELMQKRNVWMADRAIMTVALYNGKGRGGTFNCIEYAKERKNFVVYINSKLKTIVASLGVYPETINLTEIIL